MFKKGEFEKKLEEIGKKLKERARLEEKIREVERRVAGIEEKMESIKLPKDLEKEVEELRKDVKNFEGRVDSKIEELGKNFDLVSNQVRKDVEERISGNIEMIVSNKVGESSQEFLRKIDRLERKISEVENRMGKLLEILEAVS